MVTVAQDSSSTPCSVESQLEYTLQASQLPRLAGRRASVGLAGGAPHVASNARGCDGNM